MATVKSIERRLAVVTNWSLVGSFALGFVLTGFGDDRVAFGLIGFAAVVAGLVVHVIINQTYGTGFSNGEVVVGFVTFGVAVLSFIAAWVFDPKFGDADATIGLAGFGAIVACFIAYLVIKYGLKGSFSMFHQLRHH